MQTIATIGFRLPARPGCEVLSKLMFNAFGDGALGHSAPWIATDLFRHAELRRYTAIYWEAV
jgi:hypothetical protein